VLGEREQQNERGGFRRRSQLLSAVKYASSPDQMCRASCHIGRVSILLVLAVGCLRSCCAAKFTTCRIIYTPWRVAESPDCSADLRQGVVRAFRTDPGDDLRSTDHSGAENQPIETLKKKRLIRSVLKRVRLGTHASTNRSVPRKPFGTRRHLSIDSYHRAYDGERKTRGSSRK